MKESQTNGDTSGKAITVFTENDVNDVLTNISLKGEFKLVFDITITVHEQTYQSDLTTNCEGEEAKNLRE